MRFLLDENVHRGLLSFLISIGHDATLSAKGISNGKVFSVVSSENRILITHDKDFSLHLPIVNHSGIILLKILPRDIDQINSAIKQLIADKPSPELFINKLFVLFPDHHDELPFRAEQIPF